MSTGTRSALRRALAVATVVWVGISIDVVLSNVVYPSVEDDDGVSVAVAHTAVLVALSGDGRASGAGQLERRVDAVAGSLTGVLIALATIGTFAVVDNAFLDTISQQQAKIDGLTHSGMTSMRAYVNYGLVVGAFTLAVFVGAAGAGLGVLGGLLGRRQQSAGRSGGQETVVH